MPSRSRKRLPLLSKRIAQIISGEATGTPISLRQLASRTQVGGVKDGGVTAQTLAYLKTGHKDNPSLDTLRSIAKAAGVSVAWLVGETESVRPGAERSRAQLLDELAEEVLARLREALRDEDGRVRLDESLRYEDLRLEPRTTDVTVSMFPDGRRITGRTAPTAGERMLLDLVTLYAERLRIYATTRRQVGLLDEIEVADEESEAYRRTLRSLLERPHLDELPVRPTGTEWTYTTRPSGTTDPADQAATARHRRPPHAAGRKGRPSST